jgi:uncharacterized coiled-coil protein SlyX
MEITMENREEVFIPSSVRQARILELENYSNFELAETITSLEMTVVQKDVEIARITRTMEEIHKKLNNLYDLEEKNAQLKRVLIVVNNKLDGLFELTGDFIQ